MLVLDVETNDFKYEGTSKTPLFQDASRHYLADPRLYPDLASIAWTVFELTETGLEPRTDPAYCVFRRTRDYDSSQTTSICRLDADDFEKGETPAVIFSKLETTLNYLRDKPGVKICGYNVLFDINTIAAFLDTSATSNEPVRQFFDATPYLCAQNLFCFVKKVPFWPKLSQAHAMLFHQSPGSWHNSAYDVQITALIVDRLLKLFVLCGYRPFDVDCLLNKM